MSKDAIPSTVGCRRAARAPLALALAVSLAAAGSAASGRGAAPDSDAELLAEQEAVTVVERSVSAKSDDAEESAAGRVSLTSSDLELVYDGSNQTVGVRFTGVAVPPGAVVSSAWVQFRVDEVSSGAASVTVTGVAADDPATFTSTTRNVSSRPRTSRSVVWSPPAWSVVGAAGPEQRTPELSAVIQEIVDRSGWTSGNALALVFSGSGVRTAEAFDGGFGPTLHVEYSAGPPVNQPPVVSAGPDQTVRLADGATLAGSVVDDGLPAGTVSASWSQRGGPGTATFADVSAPVTSVSFSATGVYVLRLAADDTELTRYDETTVTVTDGTAPTIFERSVSAGSDDAEESASGSVSLTSDDLELVYDGSNQTVGVRFTGVAVPAGAVVSSAWVQFRVDEASSGAANLTVAGVAEDDPATFAKKSRNVSSRPRTSGSVVWSPPAWSVVGAAEPEQRTPELAEVVQEIVDRPGWASGDALALVFTGSGRRTAEAFDGGFGPTLHVEYSAGPPLNQPPVVGSVASNSLYVESAGSPGPFRDANGNLYVLVENGPVGVPYIKILRSSDGGQTWVEMHDAGHPVVALDGESLQVVQAGSTLHVLHMESDRDVYYHTFRTSAHPTNPDTWGVTDELVNDSDGTPTDQQSCLAVRANGDLVALYRTSNAVGRGVVAARVRSAGSWSPELAVSHGGADFRGNTCVLGASDRVHLFYWDTTNNRLYHRSLSEAGVLSSPVQVDTNGGRASDTIEQPMTHATYYDADGVERITVAWKAESTRRLVSTVLHDGVPGPEVDVSTSEVLEHFFDGKNIAAQLVADPATRRVHAFWADSATRDQWWSYSEDNGPWTAPVERLDNRSITWLDGANVYTHASGQKVIGLFWSEGTTYEVDERMYYDEATIG